MSTTTRVQALVLHGPKDLRLVSPTTNTVVTQLTSIFRKNEIHLLPLPVRFKYKSKQPAFVAQTYTTTTMVEMATLCSNRHWFWVMKPRVL